MRLRRLFLPAVALFAACSALGNVAPEALSPTPTPTLRRGGAVQDVDLRTMFRDPDVAGSVVRVSVRLGTTTKTIDLALFDQEKPITVTNFLAYVNSGRHNNNFFHRSVPGFVIQGGGFRWNSEGGVEAVPTDAKIQNEPGISNLRGTIAMAKLGGDANSATSQWFVNLANNSANLDAQNGGFTVFGRVIGNGMTVVDEVAALPIYNAGSPFDSLPLKDYTTGNIQRSHTVETNSAVIPALTFSAISSDTGLVGVSVIGSTLRLTPASNRTGTASVFLTATDLEGATANATLTVEVLAPYERVSATQVSVTGARSGTPVPETGSAGLPAGSTLSAFGTPAIGDLRHVASRVTVASGRTKLAAIYRENGVGENAIVAHQNQLSGVPNALFKSFRDPVLAPGGAIAFAAKLAGPKAAEDEGVWTDLFGNLELILREGSAIPGLGGLKLKSVTSLSLTDSALIALVKLMPSRGIVEAGNDVALVRITSKTTGTLLTRTGAFFDQSIIKKLSVLQPASGSPGQGRWHSSTDIMAKLTLADKRTVAVKFNADGVITKLLQSGADDANLGTKLGTLGLPAVAGSTAAVLATEAKRSGVTAANDSVLLYSPDATSFFEVFRENGSVDVPEAATFGSFRDPVVNDQGDLLFFATLRGAQIKKSNQSGLWLMNSDYTAPKLIARAGNPATGKDGVTLMDTAWSTITSYALPDGPDAGPVFLAQLTGKAVTPQSKLGLWGVDSSGSVKLLLRTGDEVGTPDGTKRLTGVSLLNALPGSYGARRSYNATGSLAVLATFSDKTQAIVRIDLP